MALLDSEAELTLKKKNFYYVSFKVVFDGLSLHITVTKIQQDMMMRLDHYLRRNWAFVKHEIYLWCFNDEKALVSGHNTSSPANNAPLLTGTC